MLQFGSKTPAAVLGATGAVGQTFVRLVALAHNVVRGAAGGSVFNAELMAARGELPAT